MCSNVLMVHPVPDFAGNVPAGGMGFKWDDTTIGVNAIAPIPG
jgi:hypothetical protein